MPTCLLPTEFTKIILLMKENYKICNRNRTKIIATVGPSSSDEAVLEQLILNGCSVFRINFSHGEQSAHAESVRAIRAAAAKTRQAVAILGDLQGPKIRIGDISGGGFDLQVGQKLLLDSALTGLPGTPEGVSYRCDTLAESCSPGRVLVLDDGRVQLRVLSVEGTAIQTEVIAGSRLGSRKGLNLQGGGLAEEALTDKDRDDIDFASQHQFDYLCVSFPATADDMHLARRLLDDAGCHAKLISKIERAEVVESQDTIDSMINASDGVMVARGDLAVEVGFAAVTQLQKQIVRRARTLNKPVIVATQMMESMIDSPVPTRAEVSDVANAVFDYADAVMLSGETAVGDFPVEVVRTVYDVIIETERNEVTQVSKHRVLQEFEFVDESIAMASMYLANHFKGVKAIVCLTESGSTTLWMSRIKTHLPMIAMSRRPETLNLVALYKGVLSSYLPFDEGRNNLLNDAVEAAKEIVELNSGDYVALTYGDIVGVDGHTNTLKIIRVE